jgi:predicted RNA-binding Zn-ribbon protein involved in translation (DUF1610 family)
MTPEFAAAYTATTNALKAVKAIMDISQDVKINQVVIELQQSILELQAQMFAAQGKMQELSSVKDEIEAKLKARDNWDEEKKNYELKEIASGLCVYSLKPDSQTGEPHHYLCPQCFQNSKKRLLQKQRATTLNYRCQECGFDMLPNKPSPPQVRRGDGPSWARGG